MYMKDEVGIAELRQNLSKHLRRVKRGERLIVTERNRPVAALAPLSRGDAPLDRMVDAGEATRPSKHGPLPAPIELDLGEPNALSSALDEVRRES